MPTINQFIRKPRNEVITKTKSPALLRVTNNLKTRTMKRLLHLNVEFVLKLHQDTKETELRSSKSRPCTS